MADIILFMSVPEVGKRLFIISTHSYKKDHISTCFYILWIFQKYFVFIKVLINNSDHCGVTHIFVCLQNITFI